MNTSIYQIGLLGGLLVASAHAGEVAEMAPMAPMTEPVATNAGDWCSWLSNKPGTFYKSDNPWVQEVGLVGRLQWQAAYLDGEDINGLDYDDDYSEFRRFRLGGHVKFLRYFTAKASVNLVNDLTPEGGDLGWGYEDFDEALLIFNAKKAFGLEGLDALDVSYGRHKFTLGSEARASSTKLLTVERSAISNKVYGSYRPTGLAVDLASGPWTMHAALLSTDDVAGGFVGGWNDGLAYTAGVGYQVNKSFSLYWDFVYNDADATNGEDSLWNYNWATSFSTAYEAGKWGLLTDIYYGDNGDAKNGVGNADRQDAFWGAVVMPYYWIVDEKLQAVARYQYSGSDADEGIRTNSRYIRRQHGAGVNVNSGRGNEHHSIYGGLNYYLCGHNLKLQTGVEYEWLDTNGGDATATTLWFGVRTFF